VAPGDIVIPGTQVMEVQPVTAEGWLMGEVPEVGSDPAEGFVAEPAYAQQPADELGALKQQADSIKNTLDSISRRIAELENTE
jgi:hypothetical protein